MMPAARLADAVRVADRQLEVLLQHISLASGKDLPFRLSVGVVQAIGADDTTSVLKRAEMALEAADRRGGNRVYCHDGERIVLVPPFWKWKRPVARPDKGDVFGLTPS